MGVYTPYDLNGEALIRSAYAPYGLNGEALIICVAL